jgi:bifunctional non-homologous end joining protein LigD
MASPRGLPVITAVPPTLVSKPFHREGWVYEEKYDGWRVLAYKHRRMTRLVSRNGRDLTRHFPALVAAVRALGSPSRSTGPRCAGA